MRVALDVSAIPVQLTGAGRYVTEIARRLPERCELTLVTRRDDAERWRALGGADVSAVVPTGRVSRLVYEAWRLGRSAPARACDVWHAPHYTMPRTGSAPSVVTMHDLTFFTHPQYHEPAKVAFFRRAIRYSATHARALIAVSEVTAGLLDEHVPDHAPVVVAPHGVDLDRFRPAGDDEGALARLGVSATDSFVLFVGTIEPRKGLDVLARAFAAVTAERPELQLWVAGRVGWGDVAVADSAAIRLLGYVDGDVLPALMRRAAAVVYPSRAEGFGLPVLESLACGAPTVTTRGTVMEEVANGTALLCEPGDEASLAEAIVEAVGLDDSARRARAAAGRAQAERYTWNASIDRHLEAYRIAVG